jgi:DUF4097 and DUF4098 domain-containing protein YvlB
MKRKWLIVGILGFLELLICASILALIWVGGTAAGGVRFFYITDTHVEETIEESFEVDGPAVIDVDVSSDDVAVKGGDGDTVEVTAKLSLWGADEEDARKQLDVKMTQKGNRIIIRVERPQWIYAFTINRGSHVDFEISVPAESALELATSSGDLWVRDVTGSAELRAISGDIKVERFDGTVSARASSGDVTLSSLSHGGDVTVETTSGKIALQDVEGDSLIVQASSGDLALTDLNAPEDVRVRTISGDIRLRGLEAGSLTVDASSGEPVLSDLNITGHIEVETSSGDVELRDIEADSLTVDASSGQIQIERGTLDGGLDVENTSGRVTVTGVSASSYRLGSSSGVVSLDGCSGPVTVRTTSGNINIEGGTAVQLEVETSSGGLKFSGSLAAEGSHSIRSISGDVHLILPDDAAFDLDVETTSGDIDTDFAVEMTKFSEHRVAGKVNGGGPTLAIKTSSGDVALTSVAE